MKVEFENNSKEVIAQIKKNVRTYLKDGAEVVKKAAESNVRVATGKTKASYDYKITKDSAYVGSSNLNAVWEEFGTGEYALKGGGRQTPWSYQDESGNWHKTTGKTPTRPLYKAAEQSKAKLKSLSEKLGDGF